MANILVVDDEREIADLIDVYLKSEGFTVYKFYRATPALGLVEQVQVDLAILDVMMPDMDGLTLCGKLRENHNFPIIMLTAKDGEIDKITGLTLGADDYVTKPFKPLELVARVKAQLRRSTRYNAQGGEGYRTEITVGGLALELETHRCTVNEREVSLTPTEFAILWHLCEKRGKVVSSEDLFQAVWKERYFSSSSNTVMVHIRHLREKIGDSADNPKYIKTVWGVGYRVG